MSLFARKRLRGTFEECATPCHQVDERTVQVTPESFEALKQVMVESKNFGEFFLAAKSSQVVSQNCSDAAGIRPVTQKLSELYRTFAAGDYTSQTFRNIGGAIQSLHKAFETSVTIEFSTLNGQHLYTLTKDLEQGEWQSWNVHSVFVNFKRWIRRKASRLWDQKREFINRRLTKKYFGAEDEGGNMYLMEGRLKVHFDKATGAAFLNYLWKSESDFFGVPDESSSETESIDETGSICLASSLMDQAPDCTPILGQDGKSMRLLGKNGREKVVVKFDDEQQIQCVANVIKSFPNEVHELNIEFDAQYPGIDAIFKTSSHMEYLKFVQGAKTLTDEMLVVELVDHRVRSDEENCTIGAMRFNLQVVIGTERIRAFDSDSDSTLTRETDYY